MKKTDVATAGMAAILDQRKWWRSKQHGAIKRKDMDIRHKANTLAWLLTHARDIAIREALNPAYHGAPDEVESELAWMVDIPIAWMLSQPLVQALARDLAGEAGVLFPAEPPAPHTAVETAHNAGYQGGYVAGITDGHTGVLEAFRAYIEGMSYPASKAIVRRAVDAVYNNTDATG